MCLLCRVLLRAFSAWLLVNFFTMSQKSSSALSSFVALELSSRYDLNLIVWSLWNSAKNSYSLNVTSVTSAALGSHIFAKPSVFPFQNKIRWKISNGRVFIFFQKKCYCELNAKLGVLFSSQKLCVLETQKVLQNSYWNEVQGTLWSHGLVCYRDFITSAACLLLLLLFDRRVVGVYDSVDYFIAIVLLLTHR